MNLRTLAALIAAAAIAHAAETIPPTAPLVAHEWGTFTSVANLDGNPVPWLALGGPSVLPCFVHGTEVQSIKGSMFATVRMETPVIYFYTPRKMSLSVGVSFLNGNFSEWYPQATRTTGGRIEWKVDTVPGEDIVFPKGVEPNHYYEARATDSVPLRAGKEQEKLIFYRGLGVMAVPVHPRYAEDGTLQIARAGKWDVPAVIVFENRGGRKTPNIEASLSDALIAAGLYPKEAAAMLATWRESWFEEGTRVFYVAPRGMVDAVLPIAIDPAPSALERVFVGRIEVLSPATRDEIATAAANHDQRTLAKYGRFLMPFWEEMKRHHLTGKAADPPMVVQGAGPCAK